MDSKVTDELEKHIRKQKIQQMLDKAGFKLGIAPIDPEHIERVERMLKLKGLFKAEDTYETRKQNTVKSMIKNVLGRVGHIGDSLYHNHRHF